MKKLKTQLFAAMLSVLIGAISLISSTYAWYSMNTKVKADGISISAQINGANFEIATAKPNGVDADFVEGQTTATYQNLTASLYPVHPDEDSLTADLTSPADWYHALSDTYDDAKVDAIATKLITSIDRPNHLLKANDNSYALLATYFVRLSDKTAEGAKISNLHVSNVLISDASKLSSAVRLLVVSNDGADVVKNGDITSDALINEIVAGTEYQIDVYAYFDGKDENCKSSRYDNTDISVSLTFEGSIN